MQRKRKPDKKDRAKPKAPKARAKKTRQRGLSFGFLIIVLVILAGTGVFMLVQRQFAVRCDIKSTRLEASISAEKSKQESLRLTLARLKSPGRITRMAGDELGLTEPSGVIYLKFTRDAKGNMVCQSTYEKREPTTAPEKPTEATTGKTQASTQEGPSGTLTRR